MNLRSLNTVKPSAKRYGGSSLAGELQLLQRHTIKAENVISHGLIVRQGHVIVVFLSSLTVSLVCLQLASVLASHQLLPGMASQRCCRRVAVYTSRSLPGHVLPRGRITVPGSIRVAQSSLRSYSTVLRLGTPHVQQNPSRSAIVLYHKNTTNEDRCLVLLQQRSRLLVSLRRHYGLLHIRHLLLR